MATMTIIGTYPLVDLYSFLVGRMGKPKRRVGAGALYPQQLPYNEQLLYLKPMYPSYPPMYPQQHRYSAQLLYSMHPHHVHPVRYL